jgi:hypothetical protein
MVRYFLIFILLFSVQIWAQEPGFEAEIESPELIELSLDEIQMQAWQQDATNLLTQSKMWGLKNRIWWEGELQNLHQFSGQYSGHKLDLGLLYNWDEHKTYGGASLKASNISFIDEMVIGSYRPRFGSGLTLGTTGSSRQGFMLELGSLGPVDIYSPMGAAAIAEIWEIQALVFGSIQNRPMTVDANNRPVAFAKKKIKNNLLDRERIWGGALAYENDFVSLGALLYEQKHDWHHQNLAHKQTFLIPAFALGLYLSDFDFDLEVGKIKEDVHAYAAFLYEHAGFKQKISMAKDPDRSKIAYSTFGQVFTRNPETIEFAYDALFPLAKKLNLQLLFSANQHQEPTASGNSLKSRLVAALKYKDKASALGFKVSHFDREVLANVLQEYTVSRPHHWRFELSASHKPTQALQLHLNSRYHIEDKEDYKRNGFYFNSGVRYKYKMVGLDAGYRAHFRNKYGFYYLDDSYEGWSVSTGDDQVLYLGGRLDVHPAYLRLNYRHSLKDTEDFRIVLELTLKY